MAADLPSPRTEWSTIAWLTLATLVSLALGFLPAVAVAVGLGLAESGHRPTELPGAVVLGLAGVTFGLTGAVPLAIWRRSIWPALAGAALFGIGGAALGAWADSLPH